MRAIDCSNKTTNVTGAIKAAGVDVVIRYVGSSAWKCMDRAEADALKRVGLGIAAVYETTANMMIGGDGAKGARTANAAVVAAGGPGDAFIWFACDTDTSDYQAVINYLRAANSVIGSARCGVYGSGAVVQACLASGAATKGWRSLSSGWRGYGLRPAGLVLLQHGMSWGNIGGLDYDANEMLSDNIGQWGAVTTSRQLVQPSAPGLVVVHRLYNPKTGEHFYTESEAEARSILGRFGYDGAAWEYLPKPTDIPVVRFIHNKTGLHFWSANLAEQVAVTHQDWRTEGRAFGSKPSGTPVYRLIHNKTGQHVWTASKAEFESLQHKDWRADDPIGIAFYV